MIRLETDPTGRECIVSDEGNVGRANYARVVSMKRARPARRQGHPHGRALPQGARCAGGEGVCRQWLKSSS